VTRKLIKIVDTNHDHVVSLRELAEWIEKIDDNYYKKDSKEQFARTDTNKDGFIDLDEYFAPIGSDGVCCVGVGVLVPWKFLLRLVLSENQLIPI